MGGTALSTINYFQQHIIQRFQTLRNMLLSKHSLVLPLLLLITAASPVVSAVLKEAFETKYDLQAEVSLEPSLEPSSEPSLEPVKAFETKAGLQAEVDSYCGAPASYNTDTYG